MDMLQYWLGNIEEVHAIEGPKERPYPVDSTVQVTMKFASSVIGSFLFTEYVYQNRENKPYVPIGKGG